MSSFNCTAHDQVVFTQDVETIEAFSSCVVPVKVEKAYMKFIYLEDSVVMYDVYNVETLEKLINTIPQMHNITTPNERLLAGDLSTAFTWNVNKKGVHHYAINKLISKNIKSKIWNNVWRIHHTAMHVCKSNRSSLKKGIYLFQSYHHQNEQKF